MIISINGEKVKFQQPFLTQQIQNRSNGFNIIYKNPTPNNVLKAFFLRLGARQRCLFFLHLLNIVLEALANTHHQEKEKNGSQLLRNCKISSTCRLYNILYGKSKDYIKKLLILQLTSSVISKSQFYFYTLVMNNSKRI